MLAALVDAEVAGARHETVAEVQARLDLEEAMAELLTPAASLRRFALVTLDADGDAVENGVLTGISRRSGHYRPSEALLTQVLDVLEKRGVRVDHLLKESF